MQHDVNKQPKYQPMLAGIFKAYAEPCGLSAIEALEYAFGVDLQDLDMQCMYANYRRTSGVGGYVFVLFMLEGNLCVVEQDLDCYERPRWIPKQTSVKQLIAKYLHSDSDEQTLQFLGLLFAATLDSLIAKAEEDTETQQPARQPA